MYHKVRCLFIILVNKITVIRYVYLRFLGIGIGGGEENQSEGEDGEDLHCSLFDGELVVVVAVVEVMVV